MFSIPVARKLDADEYSPFGGVLRKALDNYKALTEAQYMPREKDAALRQAIANATINEAKAKYADPREQAALVADQQRNEYNPKLWDSSVASQSLARKINEFKLQNPAYLNADAYLFSSILNNGAGQAPQAGQSGGAPAQGGGQQPPQEGGQTPAQQPAVQGSQSNSTAPDESDANIYFGNQQPAGFNTGNPMADAILNSKFKNPGSEMQNQMNLLDFKDQQSRYTDYFKTSNQRMDAAQRIGEDVNKWMNAYNNVTHAKGALGGYLPALSKDAQILETTGQDIVNNGASLLQRAGHITNRDFDVVKRAKLDRKMNEDAAIQFSSIFSGGANSALEEQKFMATAKEMKVRKEMADMAWNAYRQHRPAVNQGRDEVYLNNAFQNTWKDYLTPQALRSLVKTGDYIPENQKTLEKLNITNDDINKFAKALGTKKIDAITLINNPQALDKKQYPKFDLDKVPLRIKFQMLKKLENS